MSDKTITPAEFKVDLAQLQDAIGIVGPRKDSIKDAVTAINQVFQSAESCWHSPAGTSFITFQAEFTQSMENLNALLDEMVLRMTAAHTQYEEVERTNAANFKNK